ncbi:hypothetical protein RUMLAC_02472 [[Ruminococcus] lactaris ATCC 29176]|uniref:Uncharacterized protein n=1 Tax=[Ruminococcus] lactaris ATCC 29176 TaxID=471875 RepID=B5CSL2_9FIRM|nr:hypothetical protein RUMLAC_02472 [[Ruminococcus] lactaris ATCC 29176]
MFIILLRTGKENGVRKCADVSALFYYTSTFGIKSAFRRQL